VDGSTPAEERRAILKGLARALRGAGQAAEAAEIGKQLAQIEEELDRAAEERPLPFEAAKFPGRKGKSQRAVLVELFTGANCPPCVAADVAFDGLLRTYEPRDVVLVQYHLNIPSFDPLANNDTKARARYYGISSTPSLRIDGRAGPPVGGPRDHAGEVYNRLVGGLAEELDTEARGSLNVTAERHGERIDIAAQVRDVAKPGALWLRLLLVEDVVRYVGSNGQRLHHHVVRACPGGVEGLAVAGAAARQQATVDLAELRKALAAELEERRPPQDGEWPLALKGLKVVALLQDDGSKEIVQAAQVNVPEE
jgi:hypothetical protein